LIQAEMVVNRVEDADGDFFPGAGGKRGARRRLADSTEAGAAKEAAEAGTAAAIRPVPV